MIIDMTLFKSIASDAAQCGVVPDQIQEGNNMPEYCWDARKEWIEYVDGFGSKLNYQNCPRDKQEQKFIPIVRDALGITNMHNVLIKSSPDSMRFRVMNIIKNLNKALISIDEAAINIVRLDRKLQDERNDRT